MPYIGRRAQQYMILQTHCNISHMCIEFSVQLQRLIAQISSLNTAFTANALLFESILATYKWRLSFLSLSYLPTVTKCKRVLGATSVLARQITLILAGDMREQLCLYKIMSKSSKMPDPMRNFLLLSI